MYKVAALSCVAIALCASGCTPRIGGEDYSVSDSGRLSQTYEGVILSMRPVTISNDRPEDQGKPGAGAAAGAVVGGVAAGSTMGRGNGSLAAGALGAVVGGVAGHLAEKELKRQEGFEYSIRLQDGRTVSVAQGKEPKLYVNQNVRVILGSQRSRVVPA